MDGSQLSLGEIFVMLMIFILVVVSEGGERGKGDEKQQAGDTFHDEPQERSDRDSNHGRRKGQTFACKRLGILTATFF